MAKRLNTLCIVIFYIGTLSNIFSQDQMKVDSLLSNLKHAETDTQKVNLYWDLASQYITTEYTQSINYLNKALEVAQEDEDDFRIAKTHRLLGKAYALSGNYAAGLDNSIKAIEMFKEQKNFSELYQANIIMGIVHDRIRKYEDALKYYFEALNLAHNLKQSGNKAKSLNEQILYNNIANVYVTQKDNDAALDYYKKGVEIARANKDSVNLAVLYNNLGKVYQNTDQDSLAIHYLNLGLQTREKINDKAGMSRSYYFLCAHLINEEEYDKALEYANKSLELGKEVGSLQTQFNANMFLYEIHYALEEYKLAADYHVMYKTLSDSMYNTQTMNEITRLKMQAEFDSKEAERKLKQQKARFKYIAIIGFMALCIITLAFIALLIRSKSKRINLERDKLQQEVEIKNKELTTNVMYMVRKNEMIISVAKKLLAIKGDAKDENKKAIQRIVLELQSEVDKNVWTEFELRFQKVHKDFYDKLLEKHPDLTPNESRLVALLRLNMTSKEIAAITHQNIKSVEVARARLRKKLNLTGTDTNLISYLENLY